jgi:hypothetical protein
MIKRFELPPIPESEQTPLVRSLLGMIEALAQEVQRQGGTHWAARRSDCGAQGRKETPAI